MVYRLISLLAAIVIWFWVFADRNPTIDDIVRVPIGTTELARGLVVADMPNTVEIHFRGNANVVNRVSPGDFRAYVVLDQVHVGTNSVQVRINAPAGVRITSIQPSWISVQIDQVSSIQMPVEVVVNGEAARGYVLGESRITPGEVLINGPGNLLERIGRVYVSATFNNLSEDYFQYLPVLVEDRYGNLIMEWVDVVPGSASVLIPVIEDVPTRIVPIVINLTGELRSGLELDRVFVYPATVKIYGLRDAINETGYLALEIDITEIEESTTLEVDLELPRGITHANNERVQVTLEVIQ
jgi:YbbR domain-containing protein